MKSCVCLNYFVEPITVVKKMLVINKVIKTFIAKQDQ